MNRKDFLNRVLSGILVVAMIFSSTLINVFAVSEIDSISESKAIASGQDVVQNGFSANTGAINTLLYDADGEHLTRVRLIVESYHQTIEDGRWAAIFLQLSNGETLGVRMRRGTNGNADRLAIGYGTRASMLANNDAGGRAIGETAPGGVFWANAGDAVNTSFPSLNPSNKPLNANIFVIDAEIIESVLHFTVTINNELPVSGTVSGLAGITIDSVHAWSHGIENNDTRNTLHLPNWQLLDTSADDNDEGTSAGTLVPYRQLLADGTATRDNQGTSVKPATTLLTNAPGGLRHAEFIVENYQTLRATNRWASIFIELSNGEHIMARTRRTSETNPTLDRMSVRLGSREEAINGGDIATGNVFWAPNAGAVVTRFPNIQTPSGTASTANEFKLTVDITPEGALVYEFFINGERGTEPVVGTAQLPAGTTISSVHAWGHTNSTLHIPTWEFWDTTPRVELTNPPEGIPIVTASVSVYGQVGLSWNAIEHAQHYLISYRQLPNGTESAPVNVGATLSYTITGLADGRYYEFFVRAANEAGEATSRGSVIAIPTVINELMNLRYGTWNESIYAQWDARTADTGFDVYVSPSGENNWSQVNAGVHAPLVRVIDNDANTWRVDVPGLRALPGDVYDLRIVSRPSGVEEIVANLIPTPFMRTGAAFEAGGEPGGYDLDGMPKVGVQFVYVTHENMNDVLNNALLRGSNVNNQNKTPTIVRFVGTVGQWTETNLNRPDPGVPAIANANNMVQVQWRQNITFEGIGPDAVIYGWGLQLTNSTNIEVRNLTFHYPFEDGVWLQRATHAWVHHNTFTYGQNQYAAGGEDDKAMGDGASDVVNSTRLWTLGFNHYKGTDKSILVGGNNNIEDAVGRGTMHHNFFDHTASRHPRVRFAQVHVFNNVYEGTTGYGIGAGSLARIVAEGNYFQDANRPIIMHGQGNAGTTMGRDASGVVITDVAPGMAGQIEPNIFNNVRNFYPRTDLGLERLPNDAFRSPITNTRRHPENSNGINGKIATEFYEVQLWSLDRSKVQTATDARLNVVMNAGVMVGINYIAAPTAPVLTNVVINENETFTVEWTSPADSRSYTIEWNQGTGAWIELTTTPIPRYTTTVTATENGTYAFRIVARNSIGVSPTSNVVTISYLTPDAPTNLISAEGVNPGTFDLSWTASVSISSSYVVRLTQQLDRQGNVVTGHMIEEVSAGTEFITNELAVGTWQVEIFARNGQLLSKPLRDELVVVPWYIYIDDLNHSVLSEDFSDLPVGPIRGDLIGRFNPAVLRHPAGTLTNQRGLNFTPTLGMHTASTPVMVGMIGYNNDMLITTGGQNGKNALKLQDFSPGNHPGAGGEEVQHGTFMFIDLEEEITEGRVLVEMDYRVIRTTTGNSITPIRLYDSGGRQILNRTIAQGEGQLTEGAQAGIALPGNYGQWRHVLVVLDFDAMRYDIYFGKDRIVTAGEIPVNVTGLQTISANTPTGNQGGNPSQLSLYIDNISVRTPEVNASLPTPYPEDLGIVAATWFETAYAVFTGKPTGDYRAFVRLTPGYNAYYWRDGSAINHTDPEWDMANDWVEVDTELIRLIDPVRNLWRVDIPGLPQGTYDVYVLNADNDVIAAFGLLETTAFSRLGAAFVPSMDLLGANGTGVNATPTNLAPYGATGGYLSDGRIDPDAIIMYVSHNNWVDFTVANLNIDSIFRGGNPLVVRFLGTVGSQERVAGTPAEAGAVLPINAMVNNRMMTLQNAHQTTFEGIGPDATLYGWGTFTGGSVNFVYRNLTVTHFFQQGLRASGATTNLWAHHNTFYYGQNRFFFNNEETDRTMGQGSLDIEQWVRGYTIAYNHFSGGRGTHLIVGGVQNAGLANHVHRHYGTLHHNIYENAQERNPRTRHHNLHMFNNLFRDVQGHPLHYRLMDRYTGYGIGAAHNATIWAEGNIFDEVGFPFLRSRHGHTRGYYPHTGHNHFFGDGPGFMVTGANVAMGTGAPLGSMPIPIFGEWGYRNEIRGLSTESKYNDFVAAVNALQPNILSERAANSFDPSQDLGITVDEAAINMMPPATDLLAGIAGFPALNGNANTHGWGFEGDFRPSTAETDVWSTQTLADVIALSAHIEESAGVQQASVLGAAAVAPTNVTVVLNEFDYFVHAQYSPMPSLRTITYGHTFTINWHSNDVLATSYEIQFNDNGTWRTLDVIPAPVHENSFVTQDVTDFGFLVMQGGGHDWVAAHRSGQGFDVLYPIAGFRYYTAADIPTQDQLSFTNRWVIADLDNGGTYEFRVRAVNDSGNGDWATGSYTVTANSQRITEIWQYEKIDYEYATTVNMNVYVDGIADGIYHARLSVPRSLHRSLDEVWPAQRNFTNSIYLYEASGSVPFPSGVAQKIGNGGIAPIEVIDGVARVMLQLDHTIPQGIYDLALSVILADGNRVSLPFSLFVGEEIPERPIPPIERPHAGTWFESVYAEWYGIPTDLFTAEISLTGGTWTVVDAELVRYMGDGVWRADVPGLAANKGQVYNLRITGSTELLFEGLQPAPFNRQGFAFYRGPVTLSGDRIVEFPHGTTGGHRPDGSVDPETEIWYITHENRNDLALLSNRTDPLIVRIIGTVGDVRTGNWVDLLGNLTFQGHLMIENAENITIEGIGHDAVIEGWGFSPSSSNNIIIRNLTFEHNRHDAIWLRGPSSHAWITHNTFTISGDGASDMGAGATNYTISYNQYIGTIQTMLANGNDREPTFRGTFHGNWFFNGHSRHPMIRAGQIHVFNNFYDFEGRPATGINGHNPGGQGIDVRDRASGIVEGNYFLDTNARIAITQANGGTMIHPAMSTNAGVLGSGNDMIRGLNVANLRFVEAQPGATGTFGDHQAFIDQLVPNHSVRNSTGAYHGTLSRGFGNHNIGNIGGGDNITPSKVNHFDPFNPRDLLSGYVHVMPGEDVREHVSAYSGPMRALNGVARPITYDVRSHIQAPIISQMHINPDGTFYIRNARSPWATSYSWEWDQGIGVWEPIHGYLSSGRSDGLLPLPQHAYKFESFDTFTGTPGGTYQFRITAHNSRVGSRATSDVFTITYHYVDEATVTPIEREDLTDIIFTEDFNDPVWNLGPIRDTDQLDALGIGIRRFPYLFNRNIQFDPNRVAAGVTHLGTVNPPSPRLENAMLPDIRRNDALIINESNALDAATFNGDNPLPSGEPSDMIEGITDVEFDGNALFLRDWNWNNQTDQERYATFMHITLPEQVIQGRVSVSYDFLMNRSHANMGAGIVPIQLYDGNGNMIMRRNANGSPAINGETNPGLSLVYPRWQADTNIWISIEVVLDFDEMVLDVWLDAGEGWFLYEYNVPIPSHVVGLGYIVANTATGNHANSAMSLAIDNIVVASVGPTIVVENIEIDQDDMKLAVGESYKLTFTLDTINATNQDVVWSSSDDDVVIIDGNGHITAIASGIATISVTTDCGHYEDEIVITVVEPIISLAIYYDGKLAEDFTLYLPDGRRQLEARVNPIDTNESYEWISSDEDVATVDEDGLVMADSEGEATIYLRAVTPAGRLSAIYDFVVVTVEAESNPYLDEALATLQALVDYADGLNGTDFTPESWALLQAALDLARLILNSNDLELVQAMIVVLNAAIEALVQEEIVVQPSPELIAAREILAQLIDYVDQLNGAHFTESSWALLLTARQMALLSLESDSVDMVNSAIKALRAALNALEEISDDELDSWMPELPTCPDAEDCSEVEEDEDDQETPNTTTPTRPSDPKLPQTGAMVDSLSLVGLIILGVGLATKKKKIVSCNL